MDCFSVISPEFTKPTTMTVVADELCIMEVTMSPVSSPINLPPVILAKISLRLFPARRSSASPITVMPNRKRLSPPIRFKTLNKSMSAANSFQVCCLLLRV